MQMITPPFPPFPLPPVRLMENCSRTQSRKLRSLPAVMTPAVGAALVRRGFAVVDGALPPGGAATVRRELEALQAASLLQLNTTRLVAGAPPARRAAPAALPAAAASAAMRTPLRSVPARRR